MCKLLFLEIAFVELLLFISSSTLHRDSQPGLKLNKQSAINRKSTEITIIMRCIDIILADICNPHLLGISLKPLRVKA